MLHNVINLMTKLFKISNLNWFHYRWWILMKLTFGHTT